MAYKRQNEVEKKKQIIQPSIWITDLFSHFKKKYFTETNNIIFSLKSFLFWFGKTLFKTTQHNENKPQMNESPNENTSFYRWINEKMFVGNSPPEQRVYNSWASSNRLKRTKRSDFKLNRTKSMALLWQWLDVHAEFPYSLCVCAIYLRVPSCICVRMQHVCLSFRHQPPLLASLVSIEPPNRRAAYTFTHTHTD